MVSPTTDRRLGLVGNTAFKAPVTALATGNITQSGQQTIDGVAVLASNAAGVPDRVLCTGMTDATKNGIWDVSTAAWTRSVDANGNYDLTQGSTVLVTQGSTNAGTYWKVSTSGSITIGTTALAWSQALATALSASNFIQTGTGAVQRDALSKMREIVCTKDFGCKLDGATDDAANLRLAIVAAQSLNLRLYTYGTCLINSAVTIDGALTLVGSGPESAIIKLGTTTQDGLRIVTNSKVTMRDLQVQGSASASAGSSVLLTAPGGGVNQFSSFDNVYFSGGWIQLNNGAAAEWSCMRCTFAGFLAVGIQIQDTFNTDAGDQQVIGCVFTTSPGVGTGIVQLSAGGLRLVACKFIQMANGLTLSPAAGVNISDLFLTSNSFESFTGAAVTFTRGSGNLIGTIHICGNEFVGGAQAFNMSDVGPWINNMTITTNTFGITGASTCVTLAGVLNCTFADNILNGNAAGTGLNIGTFATNVQVHHNTFTGFSTNIAGAVAGVNGAVTNRNIVIERNLGYNPVGASALSPAASPWTFSNGSSQADLYLTSTVQVTAVTVNGGAILPAAVTNFFMRLGPNEVAVVTYTGVLTGKQMVH